MTLFSFTLTFSLVWWLVLFMVLPFGAHTGKVEKGHASGSPKHTYLGRKLLITTVITLGVTWLGLYLVDSGMIDINALIGRG